MHMYIYLCPLPGHIIVCSILKFILLVDGYLSEVVLSNYQNLTFHKVGEILLGFESHNLAILTHISLE